MNIASSDLEAKDDNFSSEFGIPREKPKRGWGTLLFYGSIFLKKNSRNSLKREGGFDPVEDGSRYEDKDEICR